MSVRSVSARCPYRGAEEVAACIITSSWVAVTSIAGSAYLYSASRFSRTFPGALQLIFHRQDITFRLDLCTPLINSQLLRKTMLYRTITNRDVYRLLLRGFARVLLHPALRATCEAWIVRSHKAAHVHIAHGRTGCHPKLDFSHARHQSSPNGHLPLTSACVCTGCQLTPSGKCGRGHGA